MSIHQHTEQRAEHDTRLAVLDSLLTSPRGDLASRKVLHLSASTTDPRFYAHLAAWYFEKGAVRDHTELFVAHLLVGDLSNHRGAGCELLIRMPPYQVARVIGYLKRELGKVPRSTRTAVVRYLRHREASPRRFDRAALRGKKALKQLYASLHIRPSARADAILFKGKPPEDSVAAQVKALATAPSGIEQARIIVASRIAFPVAVGALKVLTPSVLVALIEVMSPQEVINHLSMLRGRGAFEHAEVKALVEQKLVAAQSDTRVSAFKASVAAEVVGADGSLKAALSAVTEARVRASGVITRSTALLVDKSSSMTAAIEVGKRVGAMISSATDAPLYVYAFDTLPFAIRAGGCTLADWEQAFSGIRPGGCTSLGCALKVMADRSERVDQIVIVTDEGENTAPFFAPALAAYGAKVGVKPDVLIVKVGNASAFTELALKADGRDPQVFTFGGDYYALPNLMPLLSQPSRLELLLEILRWPLPGGAAKAA